MEKNIKIRKNGITLIALVITIIVLLILAGITINLTIGQGGILTQAQNAGVQHQEAEAKQKLELALLDLQAEKKVNKEYNEDEYIDNYLISKQMIVIGDIVVVDGWKFEIYRNIPEIGIALGKGEESKDITLIANVENATDYAKAILNIEVIYQGEIASIQINGKEETIPQKTDGKYIIAKEVLENGTYTILVKDESDSYKTTSVSVTEVSEDLEIRTTEELVAFRDRVNIGATYEGRTISLVNDIDLSSICGESIGSWEIIGTETTQFKGNFDGKYNTIDNLYINNSEYEYAGLFRNNSGIVQNIVLKNVYIYIDATNSQNAASMRNTIGGIVAYNSGDVINCGVESGSITNINTKASNVKYRVHQLGGIAGINDGKIYNCYNKSDILVTNTTSYTQNVYHPHNMVGGIVGFSNNNTEIINCYNIGNVKGNNGAYNIVGGIVGRAYAAIIKNSYNVKVVTGKCSHSNTANNLVNGILGEAYGDSATITNSYCTALNTYSYATTTSAKKYTTGVIADTTLKTYASTLGSAFTADVQDKDGNYSNEGYPILKWQKENR